MSENVVSFSFFDRIIIQINIDKDKVSMEKAFSKFVSANMFPIVFNPNIIINIHNIPLRNDRK